MNGLRRHYPFNAEQTVNILGEFGPLMAMFIVNFAYGIAAGTWALIITTFIAMFGMYSMLRRLPVFPFIAGSVTIGCGVLTLLTGNPFWIQIKVTAFNLAFAALLWVGLWQGWNFFHFILHKTFHYSAEGWRRFTHNFALFFVATAISNEAVRILFSVDAWIIFKLFIVMPAAGLFAWWQSKLMAKYKIDPPAPAAAKALAKAAVAGSSPRSDGFEFARTKRLDKPGKVAAPTRNPA